MMCMNGKEEWLEGWDMGFVCCVALLDLAFSRLACYCARIPHKADRLSIMSGLVVVYMN